MSGWERVGRDTGPGRFEAEVVGQTHEVVYQFLLFNFNIDGSVLKAEHKADLDKHVVPLLANHRLHAELIGMASKSGDREYNRQLSLSRVLKVKDYLRSKGIPESKVPGPGVTAVGEDFSTSLFQEDELDRSVRIRIKVGIKPLPIYPTIVIPVVIGPEVIEVPELVIRPDKDRSKWSIRQISSFSAGYGVSIPFVAGVGAGLSQVHFLLVNRDTAQMAQCTYFGANVGGSLGPDPGFSMTMQSKQWDKFDARAGAGFDDFNGTASWVEPPQVGLGTPYSVASSRLYIDNLDLVVDVSTGAPIGFPSTSASKGTFQCRAPVQLKL